MKKFYFIFLLFLTVIIFTACSEKETDEHNEDESRQKDEKVETLSAEESEKIVKDNLENIAEEMNTISLDKTVQADSFKEGFGDWFDEWESDHPKNDSGNEQAGKDLRENKAVMDLVTENGLEEMIIAYLKPYMQEGDARGFAMENDIGVRYQIEEQDKDYFQASTLRIEGDAAYNPPETLVFDYIKEDEKWKLDGYQTISAEEEPFDLTFEDIKNTKMYKGSELVDKRKYKGDRYLIVKSSGGVYDAIRVKDSKKNYKLKKEYQEGTEDELTMGGSEQTDHDNQRDDHTKSNEKMNVDTLSKLIDDYEKQIVEAINTDDFDVVKPSLSEGSELYQSQKELIHHLNESGTTEKLLDYDIQDVRCDEQKATCEIDVHEEVEIQYESGKSETKRYNWTYTAKSTDDGSHQLHNIQEQEEVNSDDKAKSDEGAGGMITYIE